MGQNLRLEKDWSGVDGEGIFDLSICGDVDGRV